MSLQVVTAPTEEPVTLDEARASSATGYADLTDAQLGAMITSARIRLERYLDRAVAEQTLALHRSCFPLWRDRADLGGAAAGGRELFLPALRRRRCGRDRGRR
jgi:hypothetical protein